ncbi:helix-turn-helix domain-containing protein [Erythrobacter sp. JK5]|uniref:helix-turn-helix domain-containing protein n=1 Tax=Erythrobacter sp. JK5 TaxID=2829500 RepID=UPI001BA7BC81|nr:helix-turn-helix domain-containing protein [Erythrobacter sp. JK5]QUL37578.1 helix-turn-helix domain-containing protein [Erythrobacter sp. JK5]
MSLKAHLDPVAPGDGKRRQPRRALQLETSGVLPGGLEANVTIHNISAAGLLLETDLPLDQGETLAIELPQVGQVAATVVWVSEHLYGCAFDVALGQAALAATQLRADTPGGAGSPAPARPALAEPLGIKLNRLRRERGMTLAQVAAQLDVSKPTVWAWEKGKARPLPDRIDAIAAALGVPAAELGEAAPDRHAAAVVEECRIRIATACGTEPQNVRIMIEV